MRRITTGANTLSTPPAPPNVAPVRAAQRGSAAGNELISRAFTDLKPREISFRPTPRSNCFRVTTSSDTISSNQEEAAREAIQSMRQSCLGPARAVAYAFKRCIPCLGTR